MLSASPEQLRWLSLIEAAQAGDRAACELVLQKLVPRIRNLIRYLLRGDRDVDDVAQEALLHIVRGLPGYAATGAFEAWVDRVVARTTFAWIRRREQQAVETGDAEPDSFHTTTVGPDEFARRRQFVTQLDALSFEQRHALVLHHVVGFSVAEVSELTAVPQETVRSRLRLGKQRLRAITHPQPGEEVG